MSKFSLVYHPYFCEENIWHLSHATPLANSRCYAVFVSNDMRQVPVRFMRAAKEPNDLIFWDYHVFLIEEENQCFAWDPDCTLGFPLALHHYLKACYHHGFPNSFQPIFRLVDTITYQQSFFSNRQHMRDPKGIWLKPPPPWPPIRAESGSNLHQFLNMSSVSPGDLFTLEALYARFDLNQT